MNRKRASRAVPMSEDNDVSVGSNSTAPKSQNMCMCVSDDENPHLNFDAEC